MAELTSFSSVIAPLDSPVSGRRMANVPDDWLQGRSTFGGLSAALSYCGAVADFPALPPLRSAHIAFVGPVSGNIEVTAALLRQGKSVSFVGADLTGTEGLATRCVFAFGAKRASKFDEAHLPMPAVPGPDEVSEKGRSGVLPAFARHFEMRLALGDFPFSQSKLREHFFWIRHCDPLAEGVGALIAVADMPPPAILPKFDQLAPISTMTWSINLTTDKPCTDDGWWLVRTAIENAAHGYSSQDMTVWNRAGDLIITSRQSVVGFL